MKIKGPRKDIRACLRFHLRRIVSSFDYVLVSKTKKLRIRPKRKNNEITKSIISERASVSALLTMKMKSTNINPTKAKAIAKIRTLNILLSDE